MIRGILSNIDSRVGGANEATEELLEEALGESDSLESFSEILNVELKREKNG
ncbi:MAG: hypothetical protein IME98_03575 [Proteobacteria bacterium]|nr:hypothetical protein [Pseudomonadota bacterium]